MLTTVAAIVVAAAASGAAAPPSPPRGAVAFQAVEPAFITAAPGCTFYWTGKPQFGTEILRRSDAESDHGWMKLDGEMRRLKVLTEKHFPVQRNVPRYGDRLVLLLRDDHYQVDVVASVKRACGSGVAGCGATGYVAKYILRRDNEGLRELSGWGECGN